MYITIELTKNPDVCAIRMGDQTYHVTPFGFSGFEKNVAKLAERDGGCTVMTLKLSDDEIPFEEIEDDDASI